MASQYSTIGNDGHKVRVVSTQLPTNAGALKALFTLEHDHGNGAWTRYYGVPLFQRNDTGALFVSPPSSSYTGHDGTTKRVPILRWSPNLAEAIQDAAIRAYRRISGTYPSELFNDGEGS